MASDDIDFHGPIPLFPLPNVVLFPAVVQPLHIYEERYKRMMALTLADQSLLAMALLKSGWEKDYYGKPEVHPVVCVGKVLAHERVEEGKYNLLLQGVVRARILRERRQEGYRVAWLEPLQELPGDPARSAVCRASLGELFVHGALGRLPVAQTIRELLTRDVPTPTIADIIAFTCLQDVTVKQRLLEELDPVRRAEDLIDLLVALSRKAAHAVPSPPAPPEAPGETPWPPPGNPN